MSRFRLLALDVDGTLLTSQGTISERTRGAVRAARAGGMRVVLATGRRRRAVRAIAAALGGDPFLLVSQGAVLWQGDEVLFARHLPRATARAAVAICREHECVAMVFSHASLPDTVWVDGDWATHQRLQRYLARNDGSVRAFGDGTQALALDPVAVVVLENSERLAGLDTSLTQRNPRGEPGVASTWRVIYSQTALASGGALEILHPEVSKAAALTHLCSVLGVSREQVLAFGDNVNDVEMLQFAGLGIAMANASVEARAAADLMTLSNDEDGIAQALETLIGADRVRSHRLI